MKEDKTNTGKLTLSSVEKFCTEVTQIKPEDAALPALYPVVTLLHNPAPRVYQITQHFGAALWVAHLNIPLLQLILGDR